MKFFHVLLEGLANQFISNKAAPTFFWVYYNKFAEDIPISYMLETIFFKYISSPKSAITKNCKTHNKLDVPNPIILNPKMA